MNEHLLYSVKDVFNFSNSETIFSLNEGGTNSGRQELLIDLTDTKSHTDFNEVCFALRNYLERLIMCANKNALLLHASSVFLDNVCVFLLGPSTFGKSTTILNLCEKAGAEYVSDDLSIIDNGSVIPVLLPIEIHTNKFLLRDKNISSYYCSHGKIGFRPDKWIDSFSESNYSKVFFFLSRDSSEKIVELSSAKLYEYILENLKTDIINLHTHNCIAECARKSKGYVVNLNTLDEEWRFILEVFR